MPKDMPSRPDRAPATAPLAADGLRTAFRRHAAGVTVVTFPGVGGPAGFTATSVTSLSERPPLVSLALSGQSSLIPALRTARSLVVHLLAHDQRELAARFAATGVDRFAAPTRWRPLRTGEPLLLDAPVWLRCRIRERLTTGDHMLVVAEVLDSRAERAAAPLVYHDGGYGTFLGAARSPAPTTPAPPGPAARPTPGPASRPTPGPASRPTPGGDFTVDGDLGIRATPSRPAGRGGSPHARGRQGRRGRCSRGTRRLPARARLTAGRRRRRVSPPRPRRRRRCRRRAAVGSSRGVGHEVAATPARGTPACGRPCPSRRTAGAAAGVPPSIPARRRAATHAKGLRLSRGPVPAHLTRDFCPRSRHRGNQTRQRVEVTSVS
ncbi:DIM6/NTAB family protein (modular protein) [Frankia canadensis]|uniref:DIM6/NTAB family protein (Modular protein) n=1 Tax=Frankia canadensis TaxID=1836972 RepID=A0A2I2KSP7_9ACTN|nr:DIM6/NTAB family protein (modular protein) [Frankia canadensis]SOU55988.1 DIM6/NTAB family protein (modular protein) [Frankia canadensis]